MDNDVVMEDVEYDNRNVTDRNDTYLFPHRTSSFKDDSNSNEMEDNKSMAEEEEFLEQHNKENHKSVSSNLVIRSKKKSLKFLQECEDKGKDPNEETIEEKSKKENDALIYQENQEKVRELTNVIKHLILKLSNFTSTYVGTKYFNEQYDTVMDMLNRFVYNENQAMLLLSRSNTVLHQFISKVKNDLMRKMRKENSKWDIRAVRINSILTTKETAILNHFAEWLGMDNSDKQILAHEMQARMEQYFQSRPEVSVLFILENVEYYVENSKQSLLYKILDMLQYSKIKFAFIGTSQKIDIIDNFEKRIKSRFSHRQILFYSEELSTFQECIDDTITTIKRSTETTKIGEEFLTELHNFIKDEDYGCTKIFQKLFERGKDYEFLCRTLKIALSHLNSTYKSEPNKISTFKQDGGTFFKESLKYVENLSTSNDFKTILSKMPEAYYIVLVSGMNSYRNCKLDYFTFSLAYKEYICFRNRKQENMNLTKDTVIKIFIDLINKGFFKSKSNTDYISVNNKVVLGIEENELLDMVLKNMEKHGNLSDNLKIFANNKST